MTGFISFLLANHNLLLILHVLVVAIGIGGVTITDILFFRFMKNGGISRQEAEMMATISKTIQVAVIFIVLTGLGLYLPLAEELNHSPKFLVNMIAVAVLVVNGIFLNVSLMPRVLKGEFNQVRRQSLALGAVSFISWYVAFFLGIIRDLPIGFWPLLGIYLVILTIGVIVSQMLYWK